MFLPFPFETAQFIQLLTSHRKTKSSNMLLVCCLERHCSQSGLLKALKFLADFWLRRKQSAGKLTIGCKQISMRHEKNYIYSAHLLDGRPIARRRCPMADQRP
jgi:hypothetical protein